MPSSWERKERLFSFYHHILREMIYDGCIGCFQNPTAIILEHGIPAEFEHTQDAFFYNALIHFGNAEFAVFKNNRHFLYCLLYTSPSPRDGLLSRMPSSA